MKIIISSHFSSASCVCILSRTYTCVSYTYTASAFMYVRSRWERKERIRWATDDDCHNSQEWQRICLFFFVPRKPSKIHFLTPFPDFGRNFVVSFLCSVDSVAAADWRIIWFTIGCVVAVLFFFLLLTLSLSCCCCCRFSYPCTYCLRLFCFVISSSCCCFGLWVAASGMVQREYGVHLDSCVVCVVLWRDWYTVSWGSG